MLETMLWGFGGVGVLEMRLTVAQLPEDKEADKGNECQMAEAQPPSEHDVLPGQVQEDANN